MISDICYVEGLNNYVIIHTRLKKYVTYLTIRGIEESLSSEGFIRIHKSYLVALHAISTIDGNEIIVTDIGKIPISKYYKERVMSRIDKLLFKR